jgi:hypothetical protein
MKRFVAAVGASLLVGLWIGCAHELVELEPFPCAENGLCPEGYACAEGLCRRGSTGEPDGSSEQPDAATPSDAGNGRDAGAADAATDAATDAGSGPDAGAVDAGAPLDAGYPTSPLAWGQMALPASPNPMPKLRAVHGLSPTLAYAVGTGGLILRYDGEQWSTVYTEPDGALLRGVHVRPDGAVFAVGDGALVSCKAGCETAAGYSSYRPAGAALSGLCGDGSRVFAVGEFDGEGVIYGFDDVLAQPWFLKLADAGRLFKSCWMAPDGAVFLTSRSTSASADGEVLRWKSAMTPETIEYTGVDPTLMFFNAVWGDDDELFIGGSRKNIFGRSPATNAWSPVYKPNNMGDIWSMAGDGVEVYAGGAMFSLDTSYQLVARKHGVWNWCEGPPITISGLWSAGPRSYFAVGWDEANRGRIYLGER